MAEAKPLGLSRKDCPEHRERLRLARSTAEMFTCAVIHESVWLWQGFPAALRKQYFRAIGDVLLTQWYGALSPDGSDWQVVTGITVPCSYWEPAEYVDSLKHLPHRERDREHAKFLALCVRNGPLEDVHVKHITDAQMHRLNVCMRAALYSALVAVELPDDACEKYLDELGACFPLLEGLRFRLLHTDERVQEAAHAWRKFWNEGVSAPS